MSIDVMEMDRKREKKMEMGQLVTETEGEG